VFPLQSKAAAERRWYGSFAASVAGSTTAFRDALTDAIDLLKKAEERDQGGGGSQQVNRKRWIVALTDGEDNRSRISQQDMIQQLKRANADAGIQLVTVGLAIQQGTQAHTETKSLCEATAEGVYIDASGAGRELDEAFAKVADMLAEPALVVETF
jgi:hypothetical protein